LFFKGTTPPELFYLVFLKNGSNLIPEAGVLISGKENAELLKVFCLSWCQPHQGQKKIKILLLAVLVPIIILEIVKLCNGRRDGANVTRFSSMAVVQ
jgi:hypothetical protein